MENLIKIYLDVSDMQFDNANYDFADEISHSLTLGIDGCDYPVIFYLVNLQFLRYDMIVTAEISPTIQSILDVLESGKNLDRLKRIDIETIEGQINWNKADNKKWSFRKLRWGFKYYLSKLGLIEPDDEALYYEMIKNDEIIVPR